MPVCDIELLANIVFDVKELGPVQGDGLTIVHRFALANMHFPGPLPNGVQFTPCPEEKVISRTGAGPEQGRRQIMAVELPVLRQRGPRQRSNRSQQIERGAHFIHA